MATEKARWNWICVPSQINAASNWIPLARSINSSAVLRGKVCVWVRPAWKTSVKALEWWWWSNHTITGRHHYTDSPAQVRSQYGNSAVQWQITYIRMHSIQLKVLLPYNKWFIFSSAVFKWPIPLRAPVAPIEIESNFEKGSGAVRKINISHLIPHTHTHTPTDVRFAKRKPKRDGNI